VPRALKLAGQPAARMVVAVLAGPGAATIVLKTSWKIQTEPNRNKSSASRSTGSSTHRYDP
jgi:hypothetical protein